LKGFDEKQRKPVLTIIKPLAEVSGLLNCSSLTLVVKKSILLNTIFKIKFSKNFQVKIVINNLALFSKIIIYNNILIF